MLARHLTFSKTDTKRKQRLNFNQNESGQKYIGLSINFSSNFQLADKIRTN